MSEITTVLSELESGDAKSSEKLLPLVYNELRRLAASKLKAEKPGHTLQATALVHEAYARLVSSGQQSDWNSRGHFFAAASEAMRRILIETARRRNTQRQGGDFQRVPLDDARVADAAFESEDRRLIALDEALSRLSDQQPIYGRLVVLRYFGGLTVDEAAKSLNISKRTANRYWEAAKAWLYHELNEDSEKDS